MVLASGLGKTHTGALDLQEFRKDHPTGRTLVLCHSAEILRQTKEVYKSRFGEGYSYGMYNGYEKAEHPTDFLFANLQSIELHKEDFEPDEFDYIIVDEAHHSPAETYRKAIEHFTPKFLLGMTATPDRMDDAKIEDIFGDAVYEYVLEDAVRDGWLSEVEYHVKTDDIENLETVLDSGEEFSLKRLNKAIFAPKRDEEIVRIIHEEMSKKDDPTVIIFCQTIAHAERFAEAMGDAVVVHSKIAYKERQQRLEDFRTGKTRVICTVNMLNEGIDIPRTDLVIFLRVTQSKIVFYQQLGRGLRLAEGKEKVLVLDFVSTADRLELLYQLEYEFETGQSRYPRKKQNGKHKYLTLDFDSSIFKDRQVDIIELIEKARSYSMLNRPTMERDEIINALKKHAKIIGRTPTKRSICEDVSMPSFESIVQTFGSFNKALIASGFTPNYQDRREMLYSKEEILELLKLKAEEIGNTPTHDSVNNDPQMPNAYNIAKVFGSFNEALKQAGLKPNLQTKRRFSRDEILESLKQKAAETRQMPTYKMLDEDEEMPSPYQVCKTFGSFANAFVEAGLLEEHKKPTQKRKSFTNEEIIASLKALAEEKGKTPTSMDLKQYPDLPRCGQIRRKFGSFNNALAAAGLNPRRGDARRRFERSEIIEIFKEKSKEGVIPSWKMVENDINMPSYSQIKKIFGSFKNALHEAGLLNEDEKNNE